MNTQAIRVVIDGDSYTLDRARVTGAELQALVVPPADNIWLDVNGAQDRLIAADQKVTVSDGAVFFTNRPRAIFIDGVEYQVNSGVVSEVELRQVPNPPVSDDHVIYRDILDDLDHKLAPNELVTITPGDRFFTKGRPEDGIRIFVNTRPKKVDHKRVSFEQVVGLAFPGGPVGENFVYTVTYSRAAGPRADGTLLPGGVVRVKEGTAFDVRFTDKS